MRTVVLVPRREDHGRRDENWAALRHLWAARPFPLIEGHHDDGPFNISRARNTAAEAAGGWDVAVFADADSWVSDAQLACALRLAAEHDRMVVAHDRWVNVEPDEIQSWLAGDGLEWRDTRQTVTFGVSSVIVVPRPVFEAVNGFDERFVGWGLEDNAFARANRLIVGRPLRVLGDVYHLAHDRPAEDVKKTQSPTYLRNRQHYFEYKRALTRDAMLDLVAGNRCS